ncbi:hypothetical protein ACVW0Y_003198 [Pseudomonas sp. TE3786]
MFKLRRCFCSCSYLVALLAGFLYSNLASASCAWSGAAASYAVKNPIVFETSGYKMLANKNWYNDSRYPVGSLMGQDTVTLVAKNCGSLTELSGNRINVIYSPPANAVSYGSGYRIPTSAPGVAINIEFPGGTATAGGILVGTSLGIVTSGGLLTPTGSRIPPVKVNLSIVKTGPFSNSNDGAIRVDGGLGWFRYSSATTSGLVSVSEDQLQFPTKYSSAREGDYLGYTSSPICHLNSLGSVSLATGPKVITLSPVSTGDFSGIGAIAKGAKSQQFTFTCLGTADTKPTVYFDATFPFNNGLDGVGMPGADSDIGVQILLNDVPVRFGQNSPVLGWNLTPLNTGITDVFYGFISPQGFYCRANCGTDMSNSNWVDGGAAMGNNDGINAAVTFKYYQTKNKAPDPKSFSVPFTITLDIQ